MIASTWARCAVVTSERPWVPDQPSVAQFGERAEVLGNEVLTHPAHVHHVQMVPPELTQVLLDLAAPSPAL